MKKLLLSLVVLGALVGTVNAEWILKNPSSIKTNDKGKLKFEYSTTAISVHKTASACLADLKSKYNELVSKVNDTKGTPVVDNFPSYEVTIGEGTDVEFKINGGFFCEEEK